MNREQSIKQVQESGIVGAGGAGFPAHVKINAKVEYVIANGAECEPLLYKDKELMRLEPEAVVEGIAKVMEITGATQGVVALKKKNEEAIPKYELILKKTKGIELFILGDFYPSGDEVILVVDVTGRNVPPGGLPLNVGCVVSNVETLMNITYALNDNTPVTDKYVTMCGAVKNPLTLKVPIGISLRELIDLSGGLTEPDCIFLKGGAMMGTAVTNLDDPITKTTAGYIALNKDHQLAKRKTISYHSMERIGKSACDQCSYCTEFCPRYLVGHPIQPHRVMRSLQFSGPTFENESHWAIACIACGICGLYACPEDLSPHEICDQVKKELGKKGIRVQPPPVPVKSHPMQEYRRVPTSKLMHKLHLTPYDHPAHFEDLKYQPNQVTLPLKQHAGVPAESLVKVGQSVKKGQMIANVPEGKLGVPIHASISGQVIAVNGNIVIEK